MCGADSCAASAVFAVALHLLAARQRRGAKVSLCPMEGSSAACVRYSPMQRAGARGQANAKSLGKLLKVASIQGAQSFSSMGNACAINNQQIRAKQSASLV